MNLLVSVCMITYNHENFISEAIEGVLMQVVDFEVEFIIADDCSADRTGLIIQKYLNNHPRGKWIRYTRHSVNLGMMRNFVWAIEACKGRYIALCEGDDYWIDNLKLQKQVQYLENNKDCSLVGHRSKRITNNFDENVIIGAFNRCVFKKSDSDFLFLHIPTASIMFRNIIEIPDWIYKVYGGDRALIFLALEFGWVGIMDFVGSVYRIHEGGIEQNYKKNKFSLPIRNINEYSVYFELTSGLRKKKISQKLSWNHFYLGSHYFIKGNIFKSFKHFRLSVIWKLNSFETNN